MSNLEQRFSEVFEEREFVTFLGWLWSNVQVVGIDSRIDRKRSNDEFIQSYELGAVKIARLLLKLQEELQIDKITFWQHFMSNLMKSEAVRENDKLGELTDASAYALALVIDSYMKMGEEKLESYSKIKLKQVA